MNFNVRFHVAIENQLIHMNINIKLILTGWLLITRVMLLAQGIAPATFENPIVPGFHSDPSICRVGDTYYMTHPTLEWYPALPIMKSKDLVNWEKIGHAIHRADQLHFPDGLPNSLGIFAPSIRYHNGTFYVITTCVGCKGNFIVTATDPAGPWSDPIWIKGAAGIDPALFWDDDGKCYYLGGAFIGKEPKQWPGQSGIWMQEIDPGEGQLLGEPKQITYGHASNARWAEGPRLFKIMGEYVLMVAEGGTNEYHAVTIFNSKNVWGPYVPNHANPVMTHRHLGYTHPIIKTGHADLVQTQNGEWWSVLHAKRPVDGYSVLCRETFLAKVEMVVNESGVTPIYNPGHGLLQLTQERPDLPWTPVPAKPARDNFNDTLLDVEWIGLRSPVDQWYRIADGKLHLDLRPQVIDSLVNPSFLAKRSRHHRFEAATRLHFRSKKENEKAGLVIYRKSTTHYQLLRQRDELVLIKTTAKAENGVEGHAQEIARVPYHSPGVVLHVEGDGLDLQFSYGPDRANLKPIGEVQDLSIVSDEVAGMFNGTAIGIYATSTGKKSNNTAAFDWFEYDEKK